MPATTQKDELFYLRLARKIDARTTACSITTEHNGKSVHISGFTHYRQTDSFARSTAAEVYGADNVSFTLKVLNRGTPKFGQIAVGAAGFWKHPNMDDPDELQTQALCGSVLRLFFIKDQFWFAQHPDGYVGYVEKKHIQPVSPEHYLRWKNGAHAITKVPLAGGSLPAGSRLIAEGNQLLLPSGDQLKVALKDVILRNPSASRFFFNIEKALRAFEGTKYLWGGKTETGIDCSGLMQTLALQQNVILPRDASMQAHVGEMVGIMPNYQDLLPGDLMFFMNDQAHVFHVGMYAGDNTYLHSSGKLGVAKSSVLTKGSNFMKRYHTTFVYGRRIN